MKYWQQPRRKRHLTYICRRGSSPLIRVNGELMQMLEFAPPTQEEVKSIFMQITTLEGIEKFQKDHELDFKYILPDGTSLRCNAAQERGLLSLSIRILSAGIPTIDELQLPDICKKLTQLERGLIIISGPTGSGKSTTQAAMIHYINANQTRHILSFEDPIEYSHTNIKSKITQRELGSDTYSFAEALKHALRHDPDVIVVGEMRDSETAAAVISMAETGHLVISTGHAPYAAQTVERVIDLFPHDERFLVQMRLASLLDAVLCQTLSSPVRRFGQNRGGRNHASKSRDPESDSRRPVISAWRCIRDYGRGGNVTLDEALFKLYWDGVITKETALKYSRDPEQIDKLTTDTLTRKKSPNDKT